MAMKRLTEMLVINESELRFNVGDVVVYFPEKMHNEVYMEQPEAVTLKYMEKYKRIGKIVESMNPKFLSNTAFGWWKVKFDDGSVHGPIRGEWLYRTTMKEAEASSKWNLDKLGPHVFASLLHNALRGSDIERDGDIIVKDESTTTLKKLVATFKVLGKTITVIAIDNEDSRNNRLLISRGTKIVKVYNHENSGEVVNKIKSVLSPQ